jgi:tetratricopeptide (TPR) repeat protein
MQHYNNSQNVKHSVTITDTSTQDNLKVGMALHQQGQLGQAHDIYKQLLKDEPNNANVLHLVGVIAVQTGNHQAAVEMISRAIEIDPKIEIYYSNRGKALSELKQFELAVMSYDKAIELKPDYTQAYFGRGNALHQLKQFKAAVASYNKVISLNQDYAEAYCNRGNALHELKLFEAAVASYNKAISLKSDYFEAYCNRGLALKQLKKFEAAVASYDKAISLNPKYAYAYSNRGSALKELKQFEAAVDSYDKAISLNPNYADAYSNRGNALKEFKQFEDAVDSYQKAIALEPNNIKFHLNLSTLYRLLKREAEATDTFSKCLAFKPKSDEEIQMQSFAYLGLGRHQEAFDLCSKVLSSPAFTMHDGFDSNAKAKTYIKSLPPMEFAASKQWTASQTIMFAGDEVYIEKFFKQALKSVEDSNLEINVHLHAMLSPKTNPRSFHRLLKKNVSFSHEIYRPEDKTGYTTRRFIRIYQLLKYFNQSILCLDIDSKVNGELNTFFQDFSKADIGIYRRDFEIVINQLIHAGMFYASPTQASLRFLAFFINYISFLEENNNLKWFADQMALLAADLWSSRSFEVCNVKKIPEKYLSWGTPTKDTLILTYKGNQKNLMEEQVDYFN